MCFFSLSSKEWGVITHKLNFYFCISFYISCIQLLNHLLIQIYMTLIRKTNTRLSFTDDCSFLILNMYKRKKYKIYTKRKHFSWIFLIVQGKQIRAKGHNSNKLSVIILDFSSANVRHTDIIICHYPHNRWF